MLERGGETCRTGRVGALLDSGQQRKGCLQPLVFQLDPDLLHQVRTLLVTQIAEFLLSFHVSPPP